MAPKQPEEKPLVSSSSEEEESGSSVAESESSDDEQVNIPTQTSTVKKPDAEAESESDSEPTQKTTVPDSSTSKRKQTAAPEVEKKKLKTSGVEEEDVKKDQAKKMFERLFSETDEIALLQGIIDFTSERGDIYKEMDVFVDFVKKLIKCDANRTQLVTKIQRLKKKFANIVKNSLKKGKTQDEIKFSKGFDRKCFDLSRKIWGENGVLVSKSRKKVEETVVKENDVVGASIELASLFKMENVPLYCLNESELVKAWDMVADGSKKRGIEEKLKKLKLMQEELCMERSRLVAESAKVFYSKNNAASSSRMR